MKTVIFDIDGTLADVSHRLHHLEGEKNWDAFFADAPNDPLIEPVAAIARAFFLSREPYTVVIVSARPEKCRRETQIWLQNNHVPYARLYMRGDNDFRPDNQIKAEILQQLTDDGHEPFLVIDDRPQVVDMWRSFGLKCLAAEWNDGRSKYAGKVILDMMVGPSSAGKSTFIRNQYKPCDVVSPDQIRQDYSLGHSPEDLRRTWEIAHALVKARLEIGLPTVLDATNIKRKDRLAVLGIVPSGQLVTYNVIDRRLEDKLTDRAHRSEDLVLKHHKTFVSQLPDILRGDDQGNVIVNDYRKHKV